MKHTNCALCWTLRIEDEQNARRSIANNAQESNDAWTLHNNRSIRNRRASQHNDDICTNISSYSPSHFQRTSIALSRRLPRARPFHPPLPDDEYRKIFLAVLHKLVPSSFRILCNGFCWLSSNSPWLSVVAYSKSRSYYKLATSSPL